MARAGLRYWLSDPSVDVNARDDVAPGYTYLHRACVEGNAEAVALLLEFHADPEVEEELTGDTPLTLCAAVDCSSHRVCTPHCLHIIACPRV